MVVSKNSKIKGTNKKIIFKQSAAESLCLARYLGLIIGDLIPMGNEHWKLYLTIRKMVDIVTSPRLLKHNPSMLEDLIRIHNKKYLSLFGYLKPKMHFPIHDAEHMVANGPIINYWCMPPERKN